MKGNKAGAKGLGGASAAVGAQPAAELLLENSSDGIFVIDRGRKLTVFSRACERITGWTAAEVLGRECECAQLLCCRIAPMVGGEAPLCPGQELIRGGSDKATIVCEMRIKRKDGTERWVETNYSPIKNESGEVEHVIGILRDIEERKQLEEQLARSRKLATLGELTSALAHELKNPLGIILSSADIVCNESRPMAQRREAATFIQEEVKRLDERLKVLLSFAQPREPKRERLNLNEVVAKTASTFRLFGKENFRVELDLAKTQAWVVGDRDQLHQVFLNLILNADQAMEKGGMLKVRSRVKEDAVELEFEDEGPGIAEEIRQKIFDPFFSTKPKGTGLGLSIVYQIVTGHEGRVEVRNTKARGCLFLIAFPKAAS